MFNHESEVKRADLNLRIEFLGLETEIYQLDDFKYQIYCKNIYTDLKKMREKFNHEIRPICTPVELTTEKPSKSIKQISNIEFGNVVSGFNGVAVTWGDIKSLFYSKYYDVDFNEIYENPQKRGELIIEVTDDISAEKETEILKFLQSINLAFTEYRLEKVAINQEKKDQDNYKNVMDVMGCFTDKGLGCSERDAELWFNNVEEIYKGEFKREDLYFYENDKTKCFLDFSMFENINLRNNILLYDIIYCAMPLESKFAEFLSTQNITIEEIIELADKGRIKFILPNSEKRYNNDLLIELYKSNPNSVITRRGINCLIACDLVEVSNNYIFNELDELRALAIACELLEKEKKIDAEMLFSVLSWPLKAKVNSFQILNFSSPLRVASFGANTVVDNFINKSGNGKNIEFEFMVNSHNIHIANSLEATYFPYFSQDKKYSDAAVANILGNILSLYRYPLNGEMDLINSIRELNNKEQSMINLLQVKEPISILKFDEYSVKFNTRNRLKDILINLEKMNKEERKMKINEYSKMILEIGEQNDRKKPDIINYLLSVGGLAPVIGTVSSILAILKSVYGDFLQSEKKEVSKLIDKLSKQSCSKIERDDIYILSKIDRIANLKN